MSGQTGGADDRVGGPTAANLNADDEPIQAAGGVVWRSAPPGAAGEAGLEVLVIHRPRYDDWTLPKGKAEPDDADAGATALREVWEETGLRCRLGVDLGEIGYEVRGRRKVVRYWAMQAEDGQDQSFLPNKEVDEAVWLTPADARARLVYLPDAEIVDRFLASWV